MAEKTDTEPLAAAKQADYESTAGNDTNVDRNRLVSGFVRKSSYALVQAFSAENKDTHKGAAWGWGALIMMNTIVGFGALTLPSAVQMTGSLATGLCIEVVVFALMYLSLLVIGYVATEQRTLPTFESLFRHYFAPWLERMVAFMILIVMYVPCIAYMVAIKGQFSTLLRANVDASHLHEWYLHPTFLMFAISIVFIFPLLLLQHIEHLRQASAVASFCVIYLAGAVIATYFYPEKLLNPVLLEFTEIEPEISTSWTCTLVCIGSFVTAYFIQFVGPPVYVRTTPKKFSNYVKMSTVSMVSCFIVYNILIIVPNLTTKSTLYEDILLNLNPRRTSTIIAYVLYIFKLCLEYPILAFVGREGILSLIPERFYQDRQTSVKMAISCLWYLSSLGLAVLVPEILTATQIVGFVASPVSLLLPGLVLLKNLQMYPVSKTKHRCLTVVGWGMILVGIGVSLIILINTAMGYISNADPKSHSCAARS